MDQKYLDQLEWSARQRVTKLENLVVKWTRYVEWLDKRRAEMMSKIEEARRELDALEAQARVLTTFLEGDI